MIMPILGTAAIAVIAYTCARAGKGITHRELLRIGALNSGILSAYHLVQGEWQGAAAFGVLSVLWTRSALTGSRTRSAS